MYIHLFVDKIWKDQKLPGKEYRDIWEIVGIS